MGYSMNLRNIVASAVNRNDPIGLLSVGTPKDEYNPEIIRILAGLGEVTDLDSLNTLVHDVFVEMFDQDIAGPKEDYRKIAEDIYAGLRLPKE